MIAQKSVGNSVIMIIASSLVLTVIYLVLYSMPVSDILTFLIAVFLIQGTYRELTE